MSKARGARVLILVAGYPPAYKAGGPVRTVEAMVKGRSRPRLVDVVTSAYDHGDSTPLPGYETGSWVREDNANVFRADTKSLSGCFAMYREMRRSDARVLYLNGLFSPTYSLIPSLLTLLRVFRFHRVYLAPRGELDPGALALKPAKKRVLLKVFRTLRFHKSTTFHASTQAERDQIAGVFPSARVIVKENETLIEPLGRPPLRRGNPRTILYLGRISRKKNLHVLLQALAKADLPPGTRLIVAGSGDSDYILKCKRLASSLTMEVQFLGAVERESVFELFRGADVSCFPTAGENFGHVIPEALSQGCPVMISDVTPWTKRIVDGGGTIVRGVGDSDNWARALEMFLAKTEAEWDSIAAQALNAYLDWSKSREDRTFLDLIDGLQ